MPTHWGCLPGGLLGGGRAGGGARAQARRTPLPHRCPAPWERRGGREAAELGRGRRGEPGYPVLISTRAMRAEVGRLRSEANAAPLCAPRPPSLILGRGGADPSSLSTAASLQQGAAAPGAGVGTEWAAGRAYFRVPSLRPGLVGAGAALTGPDSARNGTGDAARRGPRCAALQLSRRRRPGAPPPPPILAPAPRPHRRPHSPRAGREPPRGAEPRRRPPFSSSHPLFNRFVPARGPSGPAFGGWWAGSPSLPHPLHHALGPLFWGGSLPFVFVRGKMPSACRQMGRGVLSMSVYKRSPLFFPSKAGPQSEERASVGVLQQRRKMDTVGIFGRGCAFLARWMAPSALAVMQHNAAVSQPPLVLAAGVGTATRRLRPPPGPTQARGCPWPRPGAASTLSCCFSWMWRLEDQVT